MNPMPTLKELHKQSIQQYQTFYSLTLALEDSLKSMDTDNILRLIGELDHIRETVQKTDARLNEFFKQIPQKKQTALNVDRFKLIQKVMNKTSTLSPKVRAMMAMQAAELSKIKQGRNTLGGYARQTSKSGRIINTAN